MTRTPSVGDRVKWQSLDASIPPTFGKIVSMDSSGTHATIEWNDGDVDQYEMHGASCVTVIKAKGEA